LRAAKAIFEAGASASMSQQPNWTLARFGAAGLVLGLFLSGGDGAPPIDCLGQCKTEPSWRYQESCRAKCAAAELETRRNAHRDCLERCKSEPTSRRDWLECNARCG
jgi:hypothetical protein